MKTSEKDIAKMTAELLSSQVKKGKTPVIINNYLGGYPEKNCKVLEIKFFYKDWVYSMSHIDGVNMFIDLVEMPKEEIIKKDDGIIFLKNQLEQLYTYRKNWSDEEANIYASNIYWLVKFGEIKNDNFNGMTCIYI